MTLLFKCDHTDPDLWLTALAEQMPEREVRVLPEVGACWRACLTSRRSFPYGLGSTTWRATTSCRRCR
jgi:hypothetical protein